MNLVAAENFYDDLARQIGGNAVEVSSILSNPDDDLHLFETSPSTARTIADARIVIYNGADYDPWTDKLLSGSWNSLLLSFELFPAAANSSDSWTHLNRKTNLAGPPCGYLC